jgi:hypothetical protein
MRDTPDGMDTVKKGSAAQVIREARWEALWNDLSSLPWASAHSPNAVVARNGFIIEQRWARPQVVEQREKALANIPTKARREKAGVKGSIPSFVELTETEQMVYGAMDSSNPKSVEMVAAETGLHRFRVEHALRILSGHMLVRWVRRGEMSGYVKFLDRHVD